MKVDRGADGEFWKRSALRDDVYERILDRLLGGLYGPDDLLKIDQLAREFGISQTPIREALVELEKTGLVERMARRGNRVAPPFTNEQMHDLIEVRIILEGVAVRRAYAQKAKVVPELRAAMEKHRWAVRNLEIADGSLRFGELRSYFVADWNFHEIVLRYAGNPYISASVDALSFQVHRMRQALGTGTSDGPDALGENAEILQAFEFGAVTEAERALEDHLAQVLGRSLSGR